jgi:hypothetical protein
VPITSASCEATRALNAIAEATKAMQDGTTYLLDSDQEQHTQIILLLKASLHEQRTFNARLSSPRLDRQGTWSICASRVLALRAPCSPALWASLVRAMRASCAWCRHSCRRSICAPSSWLRLLACRFRTAIVAGSLGVGRRLAARREADIAPPLWRDLLHRMRDMSRIA